jgi:predicted histone-like DNA-binding protein
MIKFKVVEKGEPGVTGGGEKKYYAQAVRKGVYTLEKLSREVAYKSTMSEGDVTGVLITLVETMGTFLEEGYQVELGHLGSLRVSINSRGEATPEEVSAASVRKARILFRPGERIRKMLSSIKFVKQ